MMIITIKIFNKEKHLIVVNVKQLIICIFKKEKHLMNLNKFNHQNLKKNEESLKIQKEIQKSKILQILQKMKVKWRVLSKLILKK